MLFRLSDTVQRRGCHRATARIEALHTASVFVFKGDYGLPDKAKFKILELELES